MTLLAVRLDHLPMSRLGSLLCHGDPMHNTVQLASDISGVLPLWNKCNGYNMDFSILEERVDSTATRARLLLRRLPKICSGKTSEAGSNPLFDMCLLKGGHLAKHCSFLRFPSVLESTLVCALALRAVLL